jgi:hypothetical protein
MFNNFFPKKHAINVIRWKNVVEPDRPETTQHNAYVLHAG